MDRSLGNLSRRRLVAAAAAGTTLAATIGSTKALAAPATVDTVLEWYDVTAGAITTGTRPQVTSSRTWAIAWLAAARALGGRPGGAYRDAALASAVHESLSALLPDSASALDAALATTLGRVPAGPDRDRGLAAGRAEARALLASRAGDGLETAASVNPPFPTPAPDSGIWQPTPSAFTTGQQAGSRFATPFLLTRGDQYRPGPPPALGSARYVADLAEVRDYGGAESALRTPAQADTATFWLGSSLVLYTGVLRAAVAQSPRGAAWRARLVALFHLALVDTQIATSDAKYAYLRWRPVTAIRATEDPAWTPFHATPAHPDYPSGHNTYSGAAEQVLTALVGPRSRAPFTIGSPSQPGATRTYTSWKPLSDENVDARVWSGIHTRTADEVGIRLGKAVAAHAVRNAWRLFT